MLHNRQSPAQLGRLLPPLPWLWCQCVRQCQATLPRSVHPTLLHHCIAEKEVEVVRLLMAIYKRGRNESDTLSEGPRSPYKCVYMQEYMGKVGVCACINAHTCVFVYRHLRKTYMGWKIPERATNNQYGGQEKKVPPFPWAPTAAPPLPKTMAGSQGERKGWGGAEPGWASSVSH